MMASTCRTTFRCLRIYWSNALNVRVTGSTLVSESSWLIYIIDTFQDLRRGAHRRNNESAPSVSDGAYGLERFGPSIVTSWLHNEDDDHSDGICQMSHIMNHGIVLVLLMMEST